MKYTFFLLIFSVLFSCKTKKNLTTSVTSQEKQSTQNSAVAISPDVIGQWMLYRINNNMDDEMIRITLTIVENEKNTSFEGNDGCNSYFGTFGLKENNKISVGDLAKTERECIVPAKYANDFYKVFEQAATYKFDGESLYILSADGDQSLQFIRKE